MFAQTVLRSVVCAHDAGCSHHHGESEKFHYDANIQCIDIIIIESVYLCNKRNIII